MLGGYLLGSLPFGYWLPRLFRHEDIRTRGSGNVGASNVFRAYDAGWGSRSPFSTSARASRPPLSGCGPGRADRRAAGAAAMVGHARPVFLRFEKGGKMVATAGGAFLALAPLAALGCVAAWLVVFVLTRYASLASIVTALALVVLVLAIGYPRPVLVFAAVGAAAVIFLHRLNIRRLLGGTEHRFELSVRKTGIR